MDTITWYSHDVLYVHVCINKLAIHDDHTNSWPWVPDCEAPLEAVISMTLAPAGDKKKYLGLVMWNLPHNFHLISTSWSVKTMKFQTKLKDFSYCPLSPTASAGFTHSMESPTNTPLSLEIIPSAAVLWQQWNIYRIVVGTTDITVWSKGFVSDQHTCALVMGIAHVHTLNGNANVCTPSTHSHMLHASHTEMANFIEVAAPANGSSQLKLLIVS